MIQPGGPGAVFNFAFGNHTTTNYYISLEFPDGTRAEFVDKKRLYGILVEGDEGIASIQGEWLVDFSRNMIV